MDQVTAGRRGRWGDRAEVERVAALDRERHRQSLLAWMHRYGIHDLSVAAADVRQMATNANITQEDLMEPTVVNGQRRSFEIRWLGDGQEPPGPARCNVYDQVAQELRSQPGRWAWLGEGGAGAASALRKRKLLVKERVNGHGRVLYACSPPD